MPIRIIRTVTAHPGAEPAPVADETSVVDDEPGLVFVRIYRSAYAIAETHACGVIEADLYPQPDAEPWSVRGVTPSAKSLTHPHVRQYPGNYENACSKQAWQLRLTGSRYRIQFDTLDAGFSVFWTLEHL